MVGGCFPQAIGSNAAEIGQQNLGFVAIAVAEFPFMIVPSASSPRLTNGLISIGDRDPKY
ncbi:hypothetical protein [Laspinema olomoucense]|uniref:Uncharacterized protein n=1 Tax=Laspinema olomoucense D3b TaxID=2953688 RepID=A0ABT2N0X4_9CYAN|nr:MULTISPECIES: hypothetical protein [unclassified Laspinema]MCT7970852.1 hypothetical protein [Laspinema sp. D3d]MCT7976328.1 hypothetical protein [Laspinema sp. D3b]